MAKILVVDDEKKSKARRPEEMTRQGHETHEAPDGEAAWEMIEEQDYDVVLCDINMPRLDGISLLRRTRERTQNPPEVIADRTGDGRIGDRGDEARGLRLSDQALPYRRTVGIGDPGRRKAKAQDR